MTLADQILEGDRLALSRLLTQIENETPEGRENLGKLFPHTGDSHLVGITGGTGTGKSTLVNHLARYFRHPDHGTPKKVAVVAIDPSSPFTGGAILGDRIRMRDLAGDKGVFIRSMATRGSLGWLAKSTAGVVQAMDAAGYEIIFIETVGAGQTEVDIARLAHTTIVVEAPGLGDDIQAIKAGILEIADILVINKADRPGVEATERALRSMLQMAQSSNRNLITNNNHHTEIGMAEANRSLDQINIEMWIPPIHRTIATEGTGISELSQIITDHYNHLRTSDELIKRERQRLRSELDTLLRESLLARWRNRVPEKEYLAALDKLLRREITPWMAVDQLIDGGFSA
jgi:LAO/AO transport system kinase